RSERSATNSAANCSIWTVSQPTAISTTPTSRRRDISPSRRRSRDASERCSSDRPHLDVAQGALGPCLVHRAWTGRARDRAATAPRPADGGRALIVWTGRTGSAFAVQYLIHRA